ncbi:MAG TPA: hypothetical protein VMW16_08845 [Sedimentisphaerales bacterium]|nr:hypothetical protein [Sedimentisphaerales bacterium]
MAVVLICFVNPTLGFIAAVFGLVTAVTSIVEIKKSQRKLVGKTFAVITIVLFSIQMLVLSYWRIDAPPIPDDYTIADIRSAPPEHNESYRLLSSLADQDESRAAPAIGLSEQDVDKLHELCAVFGKPNYNEICRALDANTANILLLWQHAKEGRDIIDKLAAYPEIADLTEPDLEADFKLLINLRHMRCLYSLFVCLQSQAGGEETALEELMRLDSVAKKLSLNARSVRVKEICLDLVARVIWIANFIVNNPRTSQHSLMLIAQRFSPPLTEYLSARNPTIFEYLTWRNTLSTMFEKGRFKYARFSPLKLNSTFRLWRNYCDGWLALEENRPEPEKLRVWPRVYPNLPVTIDSDGNLPWYYKAYNPLGSAMSPSILPDLERMFHLKTKRQVYSDLFLIVLNKRLGKPVSLKARACGDEYIIDLEKNRIFSPGPDAKPDTRDDIKLLINPEVVNFAR